MQLKKTLDEFAKIWKKTKCKFNVDYDLIYKIKWKNYDIFINPSDSDLDKRISGVDRIYMIHCPLEWGDELLNDELNNLILRGFEVGYIHYYTEDNTFSIGIRESWKLIKNEEVKKEWRKNGN